MTAVKLSRESERLLQDLAVAPEVVGYDHRIAELDNAGLITWIAGYGYCASAAGRAALRSREGEK